MREPLLQSIDLAAAHVQYARGPSREAAADLLELGADEVIDLQFGCRRFAEGAVDIECEARYKRGVRMRCALRVRAGPARP